ncbi:MAG: MBL fold metallo-hydrolase [Chloroflexota bacterium]
MRKVEQLGRRTFLMSAGKGVFGLLSEVKFGLGARGLAVALGGSSLATACSNPEAIQEAMDQGQMDPDLETAMYFQVATDFVNSYILIRENEVAIVDTGIPNNIDKFGDVIQTAGLGWDAVNHIIITHLHGDHVGGLGEVAAEANDATIYAGKVDVLGIDSPRPMEPLSDGDEVFGMQIIGTPGHTPGHISVYDPQASFCVLGDAMVNVQGLSGPSSRFTADMAEANESVKKIANLKFETALFGHGDPIESGASDAIAALAETL